MNYLQSMNWRYATKRMNGNRIPESKFENILEAIRLAPSSLGFQPFTIHVIESDLAKKKISEKACTQPQVMESSHLLVFAAWTKPKLDDIDDFFELIGETRNQAQESLADFRKAVESAVLSKSPDEMIQWTSRQTYLALGFGLSAAAMEEVDATPMEGFDSKAMDEVLNLSSMDQKSTVLLALGYRNAEKDFLTGAKKVRRSKEKLFCFH